MKLTPGPLQVIEIPKGSGGYWLRLAATAPGRRGVALTGPAVATIWRGGPHKETAAGNAVAMSHVEEVLRLLSLYRRVANKREKADADFQYDRLKAAMLEEWGALQERPEGGEE